MAGRLARKAQDIIENAGHYHDRFYEADTFTGPSLHFHRSALRARRQTDFDQRLEYIYAALASWGMHRMGPRGPKMVDFRLFRSSASALKRQLSDASVLTLDNIQDDDWLPIRDIFGRINVMKSGVKLVGNSKVMAHLLPNLIPPIDHEYTLDFLRGSRYVPRGIDREWQLMQNLLTGFFLPVARSGRFRSTVRRNDWLSDRAAYPWDTSVPKLIDNLVVGAVRDRRS